MILKTRYAGNRQVRSGAWPDRTAPPARIAWTPSGEPVNEETASGLPAVGRAFRLIAGLVGGLPLGVYEGRKGDKRERPDSPSAALLRNPVIGMSAFDWRYDVAMSLEATENAFLLKRRARGRVVELMPVPAALVSARVDRDGSKRFAVLTPQQGMVELGAADLLHIRGQTVAGGPFGVSRIWQHRDPLGAMQAAQRFEGSYFRNHARPDVVFSLPETVTVERAREWKEMMAAQYGSPDNAGKPMIIGGGAKLDTIELSLRDAQFIEAKKLNVEEVGRILDVEPVLLGGAALEQQDVNVTERFLAFQLWPRLNRIAEGLRADLDLFPTGDSLYPAFDVDELMFASVLTKATVQHRQIQSGVLLPDEARADNGRPPLPDGLGQIPQVTPVGGAPNESQASAEGALEASVEE